MPATRVTSMMGSLLCGFLLVSGARNAAELDAHFRKVLSYRIGDSRDAVFAVESRIRGAAKTDYPAIERQLVGLLRSPGATADCKDWACRTLAIVGSERSVSPLAALLKDPARAHVARIALQGIGDESAGDALRSALRSSRGAVRIGVMSSLAALQDSASVRSLARLAKDINEATARAAIHALSRIGGTSAARALRGVDSGRFRTERAEALIACADPLCAQGNSREAARLCRPLTEDSYRPSIRVAATRVLSKADPESAASIVGGMLESDDRRLVRGAARIL